MIVKLRLQYIGVSLLHLAADTLIVLGILAIVAFLWGFSARGVYQYVQAAHWKAEVVDSGLDAPITVARSESARPQEQPKQLLTLLAMKLNRDPLLLGRMDVPRLGLGVMIRDGVDEDTLRKAVGHLTSTAMPGEAGNTVLMAHRDTFFRPLRNINSGDVIYVRTASGTFQYTVDSIAVLAPESVPVTRTERPVLTLITCFPFTYTGPAPRRFVVQASLTEKSR